MYISLCNQCYLPEHAHIFLSYIQTSSQGSDFQMVDHETELNTPEIYPIWLPSQHTFFKTS